MDSYEPLARVDAPRGSSQPRTLYYHTDVNGAPEELTDASGEIVWRTQYQVWGNTVIETAAEDYQPQQNLRFQGQYLDRETGLHYNLFRYYDPGTGRFISPDPIGLAGGINLYAYADDPINWIDPWGLCRRGNAATKKHMDGVRNQFLRENSGFNHVQGGRDAVSGVEIRETYLKPINGGRKGGSYADLTFKDAQGRTVYVQTVDKGPVNGMSQREWDNATRIATQDPNAIVITVEKGNFPAAGSLNTAGMTPGTVTIR